MKLLSWNPHLECGIPIIDEQHKAFFKRVNSFIVSVMAGNSTASSLDFLNFLENYMASHLQTEEAFQKKSNYPAYRAHQASHDMLKYYFKSCSVGVNSSLGSPKQLIHYYESFMEIVMAHILTQDIAFSKYICTLADLQKEAAPKP